MNELLLNLLGALAATNQVVALSNAVLQATGISVPVIDPNDPVAAEFHRLLVQDDAAQAEVDQWIKEDQAKRDQGGIPSLTINARIDQRFDPVIKGYEDFMARHPKHVEVRLAYGSFLNDIGRESDALIHWEKARDLAPGNPAAWNNLANYYSHRGPVTKAFEYYAKAIELHPREPVYYFNLATLTFLFRKDAKEIYNLEDDQQVFQRALGLYRQARKLDPLDFKLATDLAQTYYYLKPPKSADAQAAREAERKLTDEAIEAWAEARRLAPTDLEREGVNIHLARICLNHGRLDEARGYLASITNSYYDVLKGRVSRNLEQKEKAAQSGANKPAE